MKKKHLFLVINSKTKVIASYLNHFIDALLTNTQISPMFWFWRKQTVNGTWNFLSFFTKYWTIKWLRYDLRTSDFSYCEGAHTWCNKEQSRSRQIGHIQLVGLILSSLPHFSPISNSSNFSVNKYWRILTIQFSKESCCSCFIRYCR